MQIVTRRGKAGKRDQEIVYDGFEGYFRVACRMANQYYRFAFDQSEDRNQAAALAAIVALRLLGADASLGQVVSVVRSVLYRQAKDYGWRMMNYYKPNGRRSAHWGKPEIRFPGVSEWSRRQSRLLI